ncbi:MAG TPA: peptidylprolyl isomerase, partial [Myxococcota bacterium]
GTVGIAHAGKDTGSSQFFLTHSAQPHLDGNYTRLGVVVDGLAAMDALQPGDVLLSVEVTMALRPR